MLISRNGSARRWRSALINSNCCVRPIWSFGRPQRCTHVGLYLGDGRYLHSSGQEHGHNRIAIDTLHSWDKSPVATHYRMELRGAAECSAATMAATFPESRRP